MSCKKACMSLVYQHISRFVLRDTNFKTSRPCPQCRQIALAFVSTSPSVVCATPQHTSAKVNPIPQKIWPDHNNESTWENQWRVCGRHLLVARAEVWTGRTKTCPYSKDRATAMRYCPLRTRNWCVDQPHRLINVPTKLSWICRYVPAFFNAHAQKSKKRKREKKIESIIVTLSAIARSK